MPAKITTDALTGVLTIREEGEPSPAYLALWRLLLSPLDDETPDEPQPPTPPQPSTSLRPRRRARVRPSTERRAA